MEEAIWKLTDGGPDRGGFKWDRKGLTMENVYKAASKLGINVAKMKKDMAGDCVKQLAQDQGAMGRFGVRGTPGFFINGRFLAGAQPLASFKRIIDQELAKFKKSKIPAAKYYASEIMGKGKKTCCP